MEVAGYSWWSHIVCCLFLTMFLSQRPWIWMIKLPKSQQHRIRNFQLIFAGLLFFLFSFFCGRNGLFSLKLFWFFTMKYGHTKLLVRPHIRHKWNTDTRWTSVQHVSDMWFYVSHLKNIIFWLGHASDTTEYDSDTHQTWLERTPDTLNTARIRPEHNLVFLFSNYLMDQKRIQRPKNSSSFRNFIWGVNRNNTSIFGRGIGSIHDIY